MTERPELIERLQSIMIDLDQAHAGLHRATEVCRQIRELADAPYVPKGHVKIHRGFEAANLAYAALKALIVELRNG